MDQKFPKNIRQIGNVSDCTKVYVEDYVDTYFNQLCEKESDQPKGAFLIGEIQKDGQEQYILVSGAVQMKELKYNGTEILLGDNTWKKACEDSKKYFEGKAIVGWSLVESDVPLKITNKLVKVHQRLFQKKNRIFVTIDPREKEQTYYKYKFNDLMELGGYFIYYEKNPLMQDYMIAKRKENCVTPSETCEDRATKDFRNIIKQKEENLSKKRTVHGSYLVSTAVILMMLGVGVSTLSGYDKMGSVGENITEKVNAVLGKETVEVVQQSQIESENQYLQEEQYLDEKQEETADAQVKEETVTLVQTPDEVKEEESLAEKEEGQVAEGSESAVVEDYYTVKSGDTLASISKIKYGTIARVSEICEANDLIESDYIYIGQKLLLP